jgi:hypothetical protein
MKPVPENFFVMLSLCLISECECRQYSAVTIAVSKAVHLDEERQMKN